MNFAFSSLSKDSSPNPRQQRFCPMFSSRSCIVLVITFKSMVYSELNVHHMRQGYSFTFFAYGYAIFIQPVLFFFFKRTGDTRMYCTVFCKMCIYIMYFLSCGGKKRISLLVCDQNTFKATAVRHPECTVPGFWKVEKMR